MFYLLLTSWKKRIHNIKTILKSILYNTVIPDKIFLCLSKTEFKQMWGELPEDLIHFLTSYEDKINVRWVEGDNTKTWKKMFPIINEFNDDDIIMVTDDDIILPRTLIEDRLNDFKKYNGEYAISGRRNITLFDELHILGATSVYKKKMLNNWEKILNDEILNTYHDERFCAYLLWLNGYKTKPNTKNDLNKDNIMRDHTIIDNYALYTLTNKYGGNKNFDKKMVNSITKLTGKHPKDCFGFFNNIFVTMTSWKKRIENVMPTIRSILENTLTPNKIYINLSVEEFPNKENDLPQDLVRFVNVNKSIVINWVEGKNTKTMKKIFPILKYLNDDDIIIDTDDDILFPKDLIKSRISDFNKYDRKYCISSKQAKSINFNGEMYVMATTSVFTKKMLNNWDKVVNDTIIKTYNDDRTYLYILWLNGYLNKPCSNFNINEILKSYNYNVIEGSRENKLYLIGKKFDKIVQPEIERLTGKSLYKSFGYFKN